MTEHEYLQMPWGIEDTIENLTTIKETFKQKLQILNLDGQAESDVKEMEFDFDRAIKALEKQIPKKPLIEYHCGYQRLCPSCNCEVSDIEHRVWSCKCGQKLDWE